MPELKCEFCGKEFKTENGFRKHMCEKKKRFVEFDDLSYRVWLTICNVFRVRLPKPTNDKEESDKKLKMKFINDKSYRGICNFSHWVLEVGVINVFSYLSFLKTNMVQMKDWTKPNVYKNWLYQYLKEEPEATSIKRTEDYLQLNGISLENISPNRLWLGIRYGFITNKYLKSKNFDVRSVLDEKEWLDIRPFIMTDVTERMMDALHNS